MARGEVPVEAGRAWVRLRSPPRGPRIYRKLVGGCSPGLRAGERAAVLDPDGALLGWGLWHPRSEIAVRLLRRGLAPADDAWLRERAAAAAAARLADPELSGCDAFRVLHAEGDDFPGLVVDRYGPVLSAEIYTCGAAALFDVVRPALEQALGTTQWRLSFDADAARAEGEEAFQRRSPGCPDGVRIQEHGVRYEVDLAAGHKTGFFCDQRENRRRLAALAGGKAVLDVCCYTGGFALSAAAAGAAEATGVDLDETAIAQARRNLNLNRERLKRGSRVRFVHADAFTYLRTLLQNGASFEIVVLDPPKFIRSRREWDEGIARYHDLNKLALRLVAPGGLLLTCSCSGLLAAEEFQDVVRRAARGLRRTVRLLRITGAGADHPVRLDFPEGAYLRALWLRVE